MSSWTEQEKTQYVDAYVKASAKTDIAIQSLSSAIKDINAISCNGKSSLFMQELRSHRTLLRETQMRLWWHAKGMFK